MLAAQQPRHCVREMIAVVRCQVVAVPGELPSQLVNNAIHLVPCEVCVAQVNTLAIMEIIAQLLLGAAWCHLKDARIGERMSAVCELRAIDLYAGVKDAQPQGPNIFVDVEQIVYVEYHRLLAAMRIHWQQLVAAIVWVRTAIEQRHAAEEHAHIDRSLILAHAQAHTQHTHTHRTVCMRLIFERFVSFCLRLSYLLLLLLFSAYFCLFYLWFVNCCCFCCLLLEFRILLFDYYGCGMILK